MAVVKHYQPIPYRERDIPICGLDSSVVDRTSDRRQVSGCAPCVAEAARDIQDEIMKFEGRCKHCGKWLSTVGGNEWRFLVRGPCPECHQNNW